MFIIVEILAGIALAAILVAILAAVLGGRYMDRHGR